MSPTHSILNNINRYVELSAHDAQTLMDIVVSRKVRKRTFIVEPGIVCKYQSYIQTGTFRAYFISKDGTESTIQFAIEDWFISDFNSYLTQTPASLHIEALEDATIQQIEYSAVEALCKSNPKFEHFFRIVAQKSFAYAQRRILSNLGKTATERFVEFNNMYPEIVQRVPQYALASYLGMTPEFLSKVRKKVNRL